MNYYDGGDKLGATLIGLTLGFTALKITGVVDWSWWWVAAPFGSIIALYVLIFLVIVIMKVVIGLMKNKKQ